MLKFQQKDEVQDFLRTSNHEKATSAQPHLDRIEKDIVVLEKLVAERAELLKKRAAQMKGTRFLLNACS